jgi:hypothetical protein
VLVASICGRNTKNTHSYSKNGSSNIGGTKSRSNNSNGSNSTVAAAVAVAVTVTSSKILNELKNHSERAPGTAGEIINSTVWK